MSIIKNFIVYGLGAVIIKALSWIAAPIALYTLPPDIMGLWSLSNGFVSLVSIVMALGLRQVFFIEYYHKDGYERRLMINEIIIVYISYAVPFLLFLYSVRAGINSYFFINKATDDLLLACFLVCFISFFTELLYQVLMYSRNAKLLIGVQFLGSLVTASISLVVLYCGRGAVGLVTAQLTGLIVVSCCGLWLYFKKLVYNAQPLLSLKKVRMYLVNGLPFIPSVMAFWFLSSMNRWLLASYGSLQDVGIYACAEMLSMIFQMVILYPLSGAYLPVLFSSFAKIPEKSEHAHIDAENKWYMWLSMGILLVIGITGFFVLKPFLYTLLPVAYQGVIPYLLLVGIGNIFLMGTYFAGCYIQYSKRTSFLAGSLVFSAVCNGIFSFFFVQHFGVAGCIGASTLSYMIYFGITYWYNTLIHKKQDQSGRSW